MVQRELVKGTTMVRNYLTRLAQAAMVHCAERWSNHPAEDHLNHLVEIFQRRPHPVRLVEHPRGNECVEGTGERERPSPALGGTWGMQQWRPKAWRCWSKHDRAGSNLRQAFVGHVSGGWRS